MKDTVTFGSRTIEFTLEYAKRKTLGISVTPDMGIRVRAPLGTSLEQIRERVIKRASWILRQQDFFLTFHPRTTARKFISGETHLYLGRQYLLRVEIGAVTSVSIKGKFLMVKAADQSEISSVLQSWYVQQAHRKFPVIAAPFIEKFKKYHVAPESMVIRAMPMRWGSCTAKGKIILNPELIKAPKACIEYVIVHELCHLVHHDHTQKFMELQTREMKDWGKWKMKLEKLLA